MQFSATGGNPIASIVSTLLSVKGRMRGFDVLSNAYRPNSDSEDGGPQRKPTSG